MIDEDMWAETWGFYGRDDPMGEMIRKTRRKINEEEFEGRARLEVCQAGERKRSWGIVYLRERNNHYFPLLPKFPYQEIPPYRHFPSSTHHLSTVLSCRSWMIFREVVKAGNVGIENFMWEKC